MSGIGKRQVAELAKSDVERIRSEARCIIEIGSDLNARVSMKKPYRLNVIAIIGPGEFRGIKFDEALLCEVGIGRIRPYVKAEKPKDMRFKDEAEIITKRRDWFRLTAAQYLAVAPHLFAAMQAIVDRTVAGWKCNPDNPYMLRSSKPFFVRSRRVNVRREIDRPLRRGIRFGIRAEECPSFVCDLYWAEIFDNRDLQRYLKGKGAFIDLRLKAYARNGVKKDFRKLQGFMDAAESLAGSPLPGYLLAELLLSYLEGGDRHPFYGELCELLGWDGTVPKERVLALDALEDPKGRLGDAQLRLTYDHRSRDLLVFEVYPSPLFNLYPAADCSGFPQDEDCGVGASAFMPF